MIPNVCPDMWDYTVLDWIHSKSLAQIAVLQCEREEGSEKQGPDEVQPRSPESQTGQRLHDDFV